MPSFFEHSNSEIAVLHDSSKSASNVYANLTEQETGCPEIHEDYISKADKINLLKLKCALFICLVFFFVELVCGIVTRSLAILSDSFHLLSDVAGFLLSLVAHHLSRRPATTKHSYGFYRIEVLSALFSTFIIWAMTGILLREAIKRITNPTYINAKLMFFTSVGALVVNVFTSIVLNFKHDNHHHHHHNSTENGYTHEKKHSSSHNINVQSASVHALGDIISSIGVIIASIIIIINPNLSIVDPICTFIFSALVIYSTYNILINSIAVLMEATPVGIDSSLVFNDLLSIPGVRGVHDLHIWNLTLGKTSLTVHIHISSSLEGVSCVLVNENNNVNFENEFTRILTTAQKLVCQKYGIHHATIQIETDNYQLINSTYTNEDSLPGVNSPIKSISRSSSSPLEHLEPDKFRGPPRYRVHCDNAMCRTDTKHYPNL